jgi:argininosuccinate synthase
LIAKHQIKVAQKIGASYVAHGATGKGNDQVRFELTYQALDPSIAILPVWRNQEFINQFSEGRKSMLTYAAQHKLEVKASASKPWSTDDNILHISYEAGLLEDPWLGAPVDIFERMTHPTQAPDKVTRIIINWDKGVPVEVYETIEGKSEKSGLVVSTYERGKSVAKGLSEVYSYVDQLAAQNGVGALGMVESRYVGMKSRGEYHAPGHTVLLASHRDLEGLCLPGSVISEKLRRMHDFASLVYAGYWFDPVASSHRAFIASTQEHVSGESRVALYKGNVIVEGRRSPYSLYDTSIASMDGDGPSYSQVDATGFIRLHALPLRSWQSKRGHDELSK